MHGSLGYPSGAVATCSAQPEMNLHEVPGEVLRLLGTHLSQVDVLSTRAVCTGLATGLAPLITSLRVPLVQSRTCQHFLAPAHIVPGDAPPVQPAAVDLASPARHAAAMPAAALLPAVLERLCNVRKVTLVLASTTTGQDLRQALEAVGKASNIQEVTICELLSPCTGHQDDRPRAYCNDMQLHHLSRVGVLTIETVSWGLQEIWQQVATIGPGWREGGSCSPGTCGGSGVNGSAARDNQDCEGAAARSYPGSKALHTLVIKHISSRLHGLHCCLQHQQLPTQLRYLSTPLPGQYSRGEIVCALNAAHESYIAELAAGLPELKSLVVSDTYEGREKVFEGFRELNELTCAVGERFRSLPYGIHSDNITESASYNLATRLSKLKHLDLLGPPAFDSRCGQAGLQTQCRQAALAEASAFRHFKFDWLRHNTNLQHLAACLLQTGEDVSTASGQLRSLAACCGIATSELLTQVAAVGSGLTSLALHGEGAPWRRHIICYTPAGGPLAMLNSLHSLILTASLDVLFMVADPAALWAQLPALQHLELQRVGLGYSRAGQLSADREVSSCAPSGEPGQDAEVDSNSLVLWLTDLPCQQLQHLWLSGYTIVLPLHTPQPRPKQAAELGSSGSAWASCSSSRGSNTLQMVSKAEGSTVLHRLSGLTLQQEDADANMLWPQQFCELTRLTCLTLHNCSCLQLQQGFAGSSCGQYAVQAPVHELLCHLLHPASSGLDSKLQSLRLQSLSLCLADVFFITCSPLSGCLQELVLETAQGLSPPPQAASSGAEAQQPRAASSGADAQQQLLQHQQQPSVLLEGLLHSPAVQQRLLRGQVPELPAGTCVGDLLAAAAHTGCLRYLRSLEVDICQSRVQDGVHAWQRLRSRASCQGPSLLESCTGLRSLQRLQLVVNSPTGQLDYVTKLGCCCGWLAVSMPCSPTGDRESDLTPLHVMLRRLSHRLQYLQELKLSVLCMKCADCGPAEHIAGQPCEEVLNACLPGCAAHVEFVAANKLESG